jgi:hypothetical protein
MNLLARIHLILWLAAVVATGESLTVSTKGDPGACPGLSFRHLGEPAFSLDLSSGGRIVARDVLEDRDGVLLTGLESRTPEAFTLDPSSFVRVDLGGPGGVPRATFRIVLDHFDRTRYERQFGREPFHFLVLTMRDATVLHHRGWKIPTPTLDPYPLLGGRTGEIASRFNRHWTYVAPLGAHPLPIVGLWDPEGRRYAGLDFTGSRLRQNRERDIATAYCSPEGRGEDFVCLAYPAGEDFLDLAYPRVPTTLEAEFDLLWSADLGPESDPNVLVHERMWSAHRGLLPAAPRTVDLSWLPDVLRPEDFPLPSERFTLYKPGGKYFEEGTLVPTAHQVAYLRPVDAMVARDDGRALSILRGQVDTILTHAVTGLPPGDGLYWPKPLTGDWKDRFGEGARTLDNVNGWFIAQTLLDLYRHFGAEAHLPYIDGALSWTESRVFTRGAIEDVPEAMFTSATSGVSFCLDYHHTFRDDPMRAERAEKALELARTLCYRYVPLYPSDNDRFDALDPSFLVEPNSARPWMATVCSNECAQIPYFLALAYLAGGDPVLRGYLMGMLERWPLLYQPIYYPGTAEYPNAFAESYGVYEGARVGHGKRTPYGIVEWFPELLCPIRGTDARILCGERGALSVNWGNRRIDLADYEAGRNGAAFRLEARGTEPFDLTLTFPFADSFPRSLVLERGREKLKLDARTDYDISDRGFPSAILRDLRPGDRLRLGSGDLLRVVCGNEKERGEEGETLPRTDFLPADLAPFANASTEPFFPLIPGLRWAFGAPFRLLDPAVGAACVRWGDVEISPGTIGALLLLEPLSDSSVTVEYADGTRERVSVDPTSPLALQGWPPAMQREILFLAVPPHEGREIRGIRVGDLRLYAVTGYGPGAEVTEAIKAVDRATRKNAAARPFLREVRALGRRLEIVNACVLPPIRPGIAYQALLSPGIALATPLLPEEIVNKETFSADLYDVALYFGGEKYVRTVVRDGDLESALLDFQHRGGTLAILSSEPYPFYYGCKWKDGRLSGRETTVFAKELGLPIALPFERPPEGTYFRVNTDHPALQGLPTTFPFPEKGDLRLRTIRGDRLPAGARYTSLLTVMDQSGGHHHDAAGIIELESGGRVLYVWSGVTESMDRGPEIAVRLLDWLLRTER